MSGYTRAVPVRLTVKRRRRPEQIVAAGTSPQRLVLRARIVSAAAVAIARWSYDADADHARYLQRHRQPSPNPLSRKPPRPRRSVIWKPSRAYDVLPQG
jgi:hypothetical protein